MNDFTLTVFVVQVLPFHRCASDAWSEIHLRNWRSNQSKRSKRCILRLVRKRQLDVERHHCKCESWNGMFFRLGKTDCKCPTRTIHRSHQQL